MFLCYFLLSIFLPPPQGDDWNYILSSKGYDTSIQVFLNWNSRSGEFFSLFFPLLSNHTLDVINSIAGALFIFVCFYLLFLRLPSNFNDFCLVFVFIISLLLLIAFEEVFLWGSGALNYLWGFLINFSLLVPYRIYLNDFKNLKSLPKINIFMQYILYFLFFIISIIAGMWHEIISSLIIVIHICLVVYLRFKLKTKLPFWYYLGIIGLIIGFCILFFSPGSSNRIIEESQMYDFLSIKDFLFLSFADKLHRIYLVFDAALKQNPLFFPIFAFVVVFWKAFKNIFSNKIFNIIFLLFATFIFILILADSIFIAHLFVFMMFIYVYLKTKDKLFLISIFFLSFYFLSILSTFSLLNLPFRARAFSCLFLIAIIVLFFDRFLTYKTNILRIIIISTGIIYFTYVIYNYYNLNKKWQNLVFLVESKKQDYKGDFVPIKLKIMNKYDTTFQGYGIDLVVSKEDYTFNYRGFSHWWTLSSDEKNGINQSYAWIFKIRSIRLE